MPTTKKTAREVAEEFENGRVIERPDRLLPRPFWNGNGNGNGNGQQSA